jgi:pilus assembly protein CpaD
MSSSDLRLTEERSSMRPSLWAASLALLSLGACATDRVSPTASTQPLTPSERYSIEVVPAPDEVQLAAHASGLSAAQASALSDFVGRWAAGDRGQITIKAPEHGTDPAGAYRIATDARDYLVAQGVAIAAVRIVGYDAANDPKAPIRVGFLRYEARGPQCGQSWENLADVRNNQAYAEFGCAVTANIAAQLADPEDLLHPRTMTAPDAIRRETVLGKYRLGEPTSTSKDTQANGAVSTTVGQ